MIFVRLFSSLNGKVGQSSKILMYLFPFCICMRAFILLSDKFVTFIGSQSTNCAAWNDGSVVSIFCIPPRFSSGLVFGIVAMLGSVVLLTKTLQQTLAQMTTDNPRMGGQQALQVVVCTRRTFITHTRWIKIWMDDLSISVSLYSMKRCFRLLLWHSKTDVMSFPSNIPLN